MKLLTPCTKLVLVFQLSLEKQAEGGLAATPTGRRLQKEIFGNNMQALFLT